MAPDCNSGYYLLMKIRYEGSTTAAHEYGHTIGWDHPDELDIRGEGVPGICIREARWLLHSFNTIRLYLQE
jgi:hypothetical protein